MCSRDQKSGMEKDEKIWMFFISEVNKKKYFFTWFEPLLNYCDIKRYHVGIPSLEYLCKRKFREFGRTLFPPLLNALLGCQIRTRLLADTQNYVTWDSSAQNVTGTIIIQVNKMNSCWSYVVTFVKKMQYWYRFSAIMNRANLFSKKYELEMEKPCTFVAM